MKRALLLTIITVAGMLAACTNSSDDQPSPSGGGNTQKTEIENSITGSDWRVTFFTDNGKDETSDLAPYTFRFNQDGSLSAVSGNGTFTGTWQIGESGDDDPEPHERFIIMIGGNADLEEIADDWVMVEITSSVIHLKDDNTSETEELKFSRIQ